MVFFDAFPRQGSANVRSRAPFDFSAQSTECLRQPLGIIPEPRPRKSNLARALRQFPISKTGNPGVVSLCDINKICVELMRFHFIWVLANARFAEATRLRVRAGAAFWNGQFCLFCSSGPSVAASAPRDIYLFSSASAVKPKRKPRSTSPNRCSIDSALPAISTNVRSRNEIQPP